MNDNTIQTIVSARVHNLPDAARAYYEESVNSAKSDYFGAVGYAFTSTVKAAEKRRDLSWSRYDPFDTEVPRAWNVYERRKQVLKRALWRAIIRALRAAKSA